MDVFVKKYKVTKERHPQNSSQSQLFSSLFCKATVLETLDCITIYNLNIKTCKTYYAKNVMDGNNRTIVCLQLV